MAVNVSWIVDCLPTIANSWDAIGVKTTLQPQDTSALFTKMDQSQDYQVVAAASNPNQFGLDADLILRYNYTPGGTWMKYTKWDASPDAKALFATMDQATREPDPAEEDGDDPGVHRHHRRAGRALPGRAHRADDRLGPEEAHRGQGPGATRASTCSRPSAPEARATAAARPLPRESPVAVIARMLVRRILILVPLLLGVVLFVFIVMRFSDNKPAYAYFQGANPTPEQIHDFR